MRRVSLILAFLTTLTIPMGTSASAQDGPAILDEACLAALDLCSVTCAELGDVNEALGCRSRCDAAATTCFGDEPVTLSSEEYLAYWDNGLTFKAAACHSTTPCPTEYGSCAAWSSFSDCGDEFCGPSTMCKICNEWGQCLAAGPATKQNRERFRVCFNAQQEGCTEYQRTSQTLDCGC